MHFFLNKSTKKVFFYQKLRLLLIGRLVRDGKDTTYLQMAQIATLQFYMAVFYQNSQPLYDVMQKEIENLKFVQGVDFEIIESSKTSVQNTCYTLRIYVRSFSVQKRFMISRLLENNVNWAFFTLGTTSSFKKTPAGLWAANYAHCSIQFPLWSDASQYA